MTTASVAGVAAATGWVGVARASTSAPTASRVDGVEAAVSDELESWSSDLADPQRGTPAHAGALELVPEGRELGNWMVERVYAPRMGAIAVVLRTPSGVRFQVDVLRRETADDRRAMAVSSRHALYVVNGGDGRKDTDEMQARGTKVLAGFLDRQASAGVQGPELSSYSERAAAFPGASFGVLPQG